MEDYQVLIGKTLKSSSQYLEVANPATEEIIARIPDADKGLLDEAIVAARKAQKSWKKASLKEKKEVLRAIAAGILDNLKLLAELETKEIGKAFKESLFVDVPLAAEAFNYYASFLETFHQTHALDTETMDIIDYMPYGVAGIFLPFNVPMMGFGFSAAAALAAGNSVIIKPSEYGSLSLLALGPIINKLDIPAGLINIISGQGPGIGRELARSNVDILSFTGSEKTLKGLVADSAASPKKIICELGGCNLSIVFNDAVLKEAVENIIGGAFIKQGQMCIGTSVALIEDDIYDDCVAQLVRKLKKIKIGNPFDPSVGIGPLANKGRLAGMAQAVEALKKNGAKVLCGGKRIETKGYFYEPAIVEIDEMIYDELFLPVLAIKRFRTNEELTEIVEQNPTGLVTQIWTQDLQKAQAWARQIESGTVWINTFAQMSASMPFAGAKRSGWGSSLGPQGFFEYVRPKHIGICYGKSKVSGWFGLD